jgi:sec-independent protein translocase protein TatB
MFNIGPLELLVIFLIALIFIDPKKLPELAQTIGKAIGEFKKASEDLKDSLKRDINSKLAEKADLINSSPPLLGGTKEIHPNSDEKINERERNE